MKKEQKTNKLFWKPFIIIGLLLILYNLLTFSEGYFDFALANIIGSLIGLSVALITFSNKKAIMVAGILSILAVLYSIFVFFSVSGFFLAMRIIFTKAIGFWIVFSIIFWIYKKVNKK